MGVTGDQRRVLKQLAQMHKAYARLVTEPDPARQREIAYALRDRLNRVLAMLIARPQLTAALRENDQKVDQFIADIAAMRWGLANILGEDAGESP